jgi:peroxiredoxin
MFVLVAASPVRKGYEVGDTVADFKLKNTNGKMVALSDYKDVKGVIVIFDCNTCPVSQAYNSRIIALHDKYASKGFPAVIAIKPNDPTVTAWVIRMKKWLSIANQKGYEVRLS